MLYYNLKPIMKLRGISHPYSFLVNAGFSPKIAQKISGGTMRSLRMSHVERLCLALMCEPNDLLAWKPNPEGVYPENLPLYNLQPAEDETMNLHNTLLKMPYDELKALTQKIKELKEEE